MGLDLEARSPDPGAERYHHFNWAAWRVMRAVLEELGVPVMDDLEATDGPDLLSSERARAWAAALETSYDRIITFDVPDETFENGLRNELHIADAVIAPPDARPLSDSDRLWISGFAQFLRRSGGVELS